jgi:hypothetical protein
VNPKIPRGFYRLRRGHQEVVERESDFSYDPGAKKFVPTTCHGDLDEMHRSMIFIRKRRWRGDGYKRLKAMNPRPRKTDFEKWWVNVGIVELSLNHLTYQETARLAWNAAKRRKRGKKARVRK